MKAFPNVWTNERGNQAVNFGMDLRDYFAAMAMQGLIASPKGTVDGRDPTDVYYADMAYLMADAMMKARDA